MVFPWFIPWLPSICGFLDLLAGSMGPGKYNSEIPDLEARFHSTLEAGIPHAYMAGSLRLSPKYDTWLLSWQSPTHLFMNSRLKSKLFLWYASEAYASSWMLCFVGFHFPHAVPNNMGTPHSGSCFVWSSSPGVNYYVWILCGLKVKI